MYLLSIVSGEGREGEGREREEGKGRGGEGKGEGCVGYIVTMIHCRPRVDCGGSLQSLQEQQLDKTGAIWRGK